jgi:hypothetical protein
MFQGERLQRFFHPADIVLAQMKRSPAQVHHALTSDDG